MLISLPSNPLCKSICLSNQVVTHRNPATIATQALDYGLRRNDGDANFIHS